MKARAWSVVLVALALTGACARDDHRVPTPATSSVAATPTDPQAGDPPAAATAGTPVDATPDEPSASTAPPSEDPPRAPTATIIDVDAQAGPLDAQLAAIAARAKKEQRPLAVELWASWCPPCKTFDKLVDSGQLDAALSGKMLVRVDVDMFDDELNELGFRAPQIPSLYHVDGRGRPQGKPLSGASWHRKGADEIGAALATFFTAE